MSSLTPRFQEALALAYQLHNGQIRKGTSIPYISHLLGVTSLVLEDGGDEDEAIAALLHDAVEDQGGRETLELIRGKFGERVAEIVLACSDSDTLPKPPWRERKERYIAHLRQASPSVVRVSLADKIHNARDIVMSYRKSGESVWERFKGGKEGTLWYYTTLAQVFKEIRQDAMAEELGRVVDEMRSVAGGE